MTNEQAKQEAIKKAYVKRETDLREWVALEKIKEEYLGNPFFLGFPDRWYDRVTYACANGHISHRYLKSEEKGNLCLGCYEIIFLVPPETTEKLLSKLLKTTNQ